MNALKPFVLACGWMATIGTAFAGLQRIVPGNAAVASNIKIFGETLRTDSICICLDISSSMVHKGAIQDIVDETSEMIGNLSAGTRFNLVAFVVDTLSFRPEMVLATPENREAALDWLKNGMDAQKCRRTGQMGSTPVEAIRAAIQMGAESIFLLTDDLPLLYPPFQNTPIATHPQDIVNEVSAAKRTAGHPFSLYPVLCKPSQNQRGREALEFYKKLAHATSGGKCIVWPWGWKGDIPASRSPSRLMR